MAGKPHQLGNLANLGHNPPPWGLDPYSGGEGGFPVPQNPFNLRYSRLL